VTLKVDNDDNNDEWMIQVKLGPVNQGEDNMPAQLDSAKTAADRNDTYYRLSQGLNAIPRAAALNMDTRKLGTRQ